MVFLVGKSFLWKIPEFDGFSYFYFSAVVGFQTLDDVQQGRFSYAVFSYDADFFASLKLIAEIIQDDFISKFFIDVSQLQNLFAQPFHPKIQF